MAIDLNEPIVHAVQEMLADELPAICADLDVPPPVAVEDFIPPVGLLLDFPTIGIGDGGTRFEDDEGFSATGRHELLVVAYLSNQDQQGLAWDLRRYTQAIVRVLRSDLKLGGSAWGSGLVGSAPGPTLTDNPENPRQFTSWTGVRIWAKKDEE